MVKWLIWKRTNQPTVFKGLCSSNIETHEDDIRATICKPICLLKYITVINNDVDRIGPNLEPFFIWKLFAGNVFQIKISKDNLRSLWWSPKVSQSLRLTSTPSTVSQEFSSTWQRWQLFYCRKKTHQLESESFIFLLGNARIGRFTRIL